MKICPWPFFALLLLGLLAPGILVADDFFSIGGVNLLTKAPRDGTGIYAMGTDAKTGTTTKQFSPCLEVQVQTLEAYEVNDLIAKVYVFDQDRKLLSTMDTPAIAMHADNKTTPYALPPIFPKRQWVSLYFDWPYDKPPGDAYRVLVVFGDLKSAVAKTYPESVSLLGLDYPEKPIVEGDTTIAKNAYASQAMGPKAGSSRMVVDRITELVVKTGNTAQPQITLFMRMPTGVTDPSQVKGTMALCMLANMVDDIRRQLQGDLSALSYRAFLDFADEHKLAVLVWGSTQLWDPTKNTDQLTLKEKAEYENTFDAVARAWKAGAEELCQQLHLPDHDLLLWGTSGAAQYAMRLALREPDMFLAVHAHIPSSFDDPTPAASKVLWLLTTGELESGYQRSLRFYEASRAMGYPMIYKAIVGLGHHDSPIADNLGLTFFAYALTIKEQRDDLEKSESKFPTLTKGGAPWPDAFRKPAYVGDMINQTIVSADLVAQVPENFRVPLPTKEIADAWNMR